MKIYIVTTGSYSDYSIHSVFLAKEKALECIKLLGDTNDANDVEEYDTSDETKFRHVTTFYVNAYDNDDGFGVQSSVTNYPQDPLETYELRDETVFIYDTRLQLTLTRHISDENINNEKIEFYENKYKKVAQDIWYIAKQKLLDGFTLEQINELIKS